MPRKTLLALAAAVTVASVVAVWGAGARPAPPAAVPPSPGPARAAPAARFAALPSGTAPVPAGAELGARDLEFVRLLRERYGPRIGGRHAQIKLIEQLVAYLAANYPADWRGRVAAFLRALFPELAEPLLRQFEALMRHNTWLAEHRAELAALPAAERRARLWQARHEAFGADAEEIWAAERRAERVRAALEAADGAVGQTAAERFDGYLDGVRAAYGEQAADVIERRQTELMNGFLELPSVQAELRQALPEQRRQTLRTLRAAIGMDAAALQRWDALDLQRDLAWDAGAAYLRERDRLIAAGAPPQELAALQDRLFGAEAEVIRSEEAAGFYRFAGERRIGRE